MKATTRGALQAAYGELAVYPAIVAMHEEQAERAEAEAARLRVALEKIAAIPGVRFRGAGRDRVGEIVGVGEAVDVAREALNGGEAT